MTFRPIALVSVRFHDLAMLAQAVHAALVTKLAYATRSSPCILSWLLSGTKAKRKACPVTIQLDHMPRCGGATASAVPSKLPLTVVPVVQRVPERVDVKRPCYLVQQLLLLPPALLWLCNLQTIVPAFVLCSCPLFTGRLQRLPVPRAHSVCLLPYVHMYCLALCNCCASLDDIASCFASAACSLARLLASVHLLWHWQLEHNCLSSAVSILHLVVCAL